jgi:hypothetical protein
MHITARFCVVMRSYYADLQLSGLIRNHCIRNCPSLLLSFGVFHASCPPLRCIVPFIWDQNCIWQPGVGSQAIDTTSLVMNADR